MSTISYRQRSAARQTGLEARPARTRLMSRKRVHVFYSGHVQGVGFRVTAEETANVLGLVGWVQNLRDGRVELLAEADEKTLVRFLKEMRIGPMRNFIKQVDVTWDDPSDHFDHFEIRYF